MAERSEQLLAQYPPLPEPLPSPVVDDHTHLDIPAVDRDGGLDHAYPDDADVAALLDAAARVGVPRAVQIGCDLPAARWTAALVDRHPRLLGGVAVHPNEAPRLSRKGELDDALAEIERLLTGERIRVVGETGLDHYRTDVSDLAAVHTQELSFREHIAMAKRLGLALQIHDRDAHADVLRILDDEGAPEPTVFHCFSGDAEMARYCVARGWYLSFAGTVTFKNADPLRAALLEVPRQQLLVETDAPFLTPVPHRGAGNAGHLVPYTVRTMAAVRGEPLEDLCDALRSTAEAVYGPW